jgi:hypothetical protein
MKKVRSIRTNGRQQAGLLRQSTMMTRVSGALCVITLMGVVGMMSAREGRTTTPVTDVLVTNGPSKPVHNSDIDNPGRTPFSVRVYPSAATAASFVVPAGKRLVITDVAAFSYDSTTVDDVAIYSTINGLGGARTIPFTVNNHGMVYADASIMDFADPGTTVSVAIDDANDTDNAGMNVDIKGYYVAIP